MPRVDLAAHGPISRRTLLRASCVALGLPLLESMRLTPRAARAAASSPTVPRRMMAICTPYGLHASQFVPLNAGHDYTLSPYLEHLREHRDDFTVFSGVSHPDVDGAHASESTFLTAAPHPGSTSFRNSISLDQFAAERLGSSTRFPYLNLSTVDSRGLAWTANGVQIPAESLPSQVFAKLFFNGSADEVQQQVRKLEQGQSILDTVRKHASRLEARVAASDRRRLDQYFTSIRQLENELVKAEEWAVRPKPHVNAPPPLDSADPADICGHFRLMCELAQLAFETDSTRIVALFISGTNLVPPIEGVREGHHILSHHGNSPAKLDQMYRVEGEQMMVLGEMLARFKQSHEEAQNLLDRTMVLWGSNLGNANNHTTTNMPILLAGGGFNHGQHLAFDKQNNYPLPNLYLSMLQRLGLEVDRFASSTSTMRGLEPTG